MKTVYAFLSGLAGLVCVIALGMGLMFAGFGETHHAWFAMILSALTGLLSLCYQQVNKDDRWVGSR